MDYLRSCYAVSMRLFPDRPDVETPGEWHWSPPGAKFVPYPHPFHSSVWDPDNSDFPADSLGEVLPRGAWKKGGRDWRMNGLHWCGSETDWSDGTPYAERGLNVDDLGACLCCNLPRLVEGDEDGGVATQGAIVDVPFGGCPSVPTALQIEILASGHGADGLIIPLDFDGTGFVGSGGSCGGSPVSVTWRLEGALYRVRVNTAVFTPAFFATLIADCGPPVHFFNGGTATRDICSGAFVAPYVLGVSITPR